MVSPTLMPLVGGTRYSTSRSTLTKYPESMLGVMFSGRHDLETMKCSDGSFFSDRDGTHFIYVLCRLWSCFFAFQNHLKHFWG